MGMKFNDLFVLLWGRGSTHMKRLGKRHVGGERIVNKELHVLLSK
jgi:hypothetical protein